MSCHQGADAGLDCCIGVLIGVSVCASLCVGSCGCVQIEQHQGAQELHVLKNAGCESLKN